MFWTLKMSLPADILAFLVCLADFPIAIYQQVKYQITTPRHSACKTHKLISSKLLNIYLLYIVIIDCYINQGTLVPKGKAQYN
jgi:hypothetical protein